MPRNASASSSVWSKQPSGLCQLDGKLYQHWFFQICGFDQAERAAEALLLAALPSCQRCSGWQADKAPQ